VHGALVPLKFLLENCYITMVIASQGSLTSNPQHLLVSDCDETAGAASSDRYINGMDHKKCNHGDFHIFYGHPNFNLTCKR
jgi:hypothetical protein